MTDYVLTGLVKRRAEVAGEIEATHEKLRGTLANLESLDLTIQQFYPDYMVELVGYVWIDPHPARNEEQLDRDSRRDSQQCCSHRSLTVALGGGASVTNWLA